jgi:hypothetical protein
MYPLRGARLYALICTWEPEDSAREPYVIEMEVMETDRQRPGLIAYSRIRRLGPRSSPDFPRANSIAAANFSLGISRTLFPVVLGLE